MASTVEMPPCRGPRMSTRQLYHKQEYEEPCFWRSGRSFLGNYRSQCLRILHLHRWWLLAPININIPAIKWNQVRLNKVESYPDIICTHPEGVTMSHLRYLSKPVNAQLNGKDNVAVGYLNWETTLLQDSLKTSHGRSGSWVRAQVWI